MVIRKIYHCIVQNTADIQCFKHCKRKICILVRNNTKMPNGQSYIVPNGYLVITYDIVQNSGM